MGRKDFARFPVVTVALVGLVLGSCFTALAETTSHTDRVCAAVKGEEVRASKTSSPSLLAVPVAPSILPRGLEQSRCSPLEPTTGLVSATFWEDLSSRAPPTLL